LLEHVLLKKTLHFEGVWQMSDKTLIRIYVNNTEIIGTFESNHFKTKFEGTIYNSSAIVKNFKSDFILSVTKEPSFKDDGKGYIIFTSDGTLNIMNVKDNKPSFATCIRLSSEKSEQINNVAILNA